MEFAAELSSPSLWVFAIAVTACAGLIKGVVGFGMPTIMIVVFGAFMPPEVALAALIMPTLVTNAWQALRQGRRAAWQTMVEFRAFLLAGLVCMLISAQFVPMLPQSVLMLLIGGPVTLYALTTLMGWSVQLARNPTQRAEAGVGAVAGVLGGLTGVWGPPTVALLTARGTEKTAQMRIQGVIYGLGAAAFLGAHVTSGVLRAATLPLSVVMIAPALIGIWLGFQVQDRIDQTLFRRLTLAVLLIAGLNLLRRAFLVM